MFSRVQAENQDARDERSQPAGTPGGSRRHADGARQAVVQNRLTTKRADTNSRNIPKLISSCRFDSRCASIAP